MADKDFIWVSTPHDPVSVSGSDPYSTKGNARLVAWYNCDEGNYITGSHHANGADSPHGKYLIALKDISGNSKSEPHNPQKPSSGTHRHLAAASENRPILSGNVEPSMYSSGGNVHIRHRGIRQQFMMGSNILSQAEGNGDERNCFMINKQWTASHEGTTSATWISGSHGNQNSENTSKSLTGGYSIYSTMKLRTTYNGSHTHENYPLNGITYPSAKDSQGQRNEHANIGLRIRYNPQYGKRYIQMTWDRDAGSPGTITSVNTALNDDWHVGSAIYDNQSDESKWKCTLYVNGEYQNEASDDVDSGNYPRQRMNNKRICIGGGPGTYGGGQIEETHQTNSINGISEAFCFDDALSTIRNGQMNAYLCDRLNLGFSSSFEYSTFHGQFRGAKGQPVAHDELANPITGSSAARQYFQEISSSGMSVLQHETAAGAFAGYGLDGGVYYNPKSTKAISLRMWVRASSLNDENHAGSHAALIVKSSSPWGHKMDNIKGYALKFGTFANGTTDGTAAPRFRLSLRNSSRWTDGQTSSGCTDTLVTAGEGSPSNIITPIVDKWYRMRLDVTPYGHNYDQIKAYVATGNTWYQLGATQIVQAGDANYRHWYDNPNKPAGHDVNNGIYNGYYVAMSSSNGQTIDTSYYIDRFELRTDTV